MPGAFAITLPFFTLIGCGYLAGRTRILPAGGVEGLTAFVFYFTLPALLFRSLALRPLGEIFEPRFVTAYAAAGLCVFLAAALSGKIIFKETLGGMALFGQAASIGNVGFLALPLIVALLGEAAAVLTAAAPIAANFFVIAKSYRLHAERASSAILVSTAISILSFSLLAVLLVR